MNKLTAAILLAFSLLGCSRAAALSPTVAALEPTTHAATVSAPTIAPGDYELTLGSTTVSRAVILHIPPAYDGSAKLPPC